ncbi:glycosyltransferase family 61 protein [Pedobacter sp. MR2016-24]|uniref:glycosyltransferase family 61 protein n=1 Tax=Pedobacter sp. MR2016-24 TaxID=2994466 RepID=UPI0022452CFB|nr:glycosyltransferase family 61 protein [Pedobacter sp. MR2016-24]MCX2482119.1 glycosyltransferase family 61 protein [Pedobacter sp. MR2016-24]
MLNEDLFLFEHELSLDIKETVVLRLINSDILREVIFNLQNCKFYEQFSRTKSADKKRIFKKISLYFRPFQKLDKAIWITDEFSSEYFHWFTDALTRLFALEETSYLNSRDTKKNNFRIILPESYKTKSYIRDTLEILNYDAHYYVPNKRLRIKELISCSHTAPTGNFNSELINKIRDRFLIPKKMPDRNIYVSREKASRRKILNEQEVIETLKQFNYEIHYFEDYNFKEQLGIMSETKSLIGLHGAGLTNMMFMHKKGKILELRNEGDSHNNCYFSLSSALDHDYYYLSNKSDHKDTFSANITVSIPALAKAIELMTGDL